MKDDDIQTSFRTREDDRIQPEDLAFCNRCGRAVNRKWNYCTRCGAAILRQQEKADTMIPPSLYPQVEEEITLTDDKEINEYLATGWKILWRWNKNDPRLMLARIAGT